MGSRGVRIVQGLFEQLPCLTRRQRHDEPHFGPAFDDALGCLDEDRRKVLDLRLSAAGQQRDDRQLGRQCKLFAHCLAIRMQRKLVGKRVAHVAHGDRAVP